MARSLRPNNTEWKMPLSPFRLWPMRTRAGGLLCVVLCLGLYDASIACQNQAPVGATGAAPRREDCLSHNPDLLKVTAVPTLHSWLVSAGSHRMFMFDRQQDADDAMALAKRYEVECFIGRHPSTRTKGRPASEQMLNYWKLPTRATNALSHESCVAYDPAKLRAADQGAAGWTVTDGGKFSISLDNQSDADAALRVARQYTAQCAIGRVDPRPPTAAYAPHSRVTYWK